MRRTFLFAFVLLVVSATSAIASTAGSTQAHRKTSAHARSSSRAATHTAAKRTTARKSISTTKRNVRYTPARASAVKSTPKTGANAAYSIGYRNGFDAGRAAALKELQSQAATTNANSNLNAQPAQPVQPATAPQQYQTAKEPSDADPAADTTNASQPAQYKTEALRKQGEAEAAGATDHAPAFEFATLEMPAAGTRISLRGSLASLQRQNATLEAEGMERILDEDDLNSRIDHRLLTPLPASANLLVNPSLPENRRYCRSWTAHFLTDLAKAHAAAFHRPFQVNSAVRTVEYQKRLMRTNGNAASAEGEIVSPHLTGATIDIGKQGMTRAELNWMRRTLFALQNAGKIDVEEEFEQACFHITVYKTYTAPHPAKKLAQPAVRDASAPAKPPVPAPSRRHGSSLPTALATGTFAAPGE
jgi:hypothetical protein